MSEKILIPSSADFETAEAVCEKLRKRTKKTNKSKSYVIDFAAPDPSLLSIQLAASCIATLTTASCEVELTGHAEQLLGTDKVVMG